MAAANTGPEGSPGPAVDRFGNATIDPTANVLQLVEAAVERLNDLQRVESEHVREVLQIRAEHYREMRDAEAARLDSIRAVDRDAVTRAAEVQTTAAATLATQVQASADAVRVTLDAKVAPILEAIAALQRAQYETAGGKTQSDESGVGTRGWVTIAVSIVALLSAGLLGTAGVVITLLLRP